MQTSHHLIVDTRYTDHFLAVSTLYIHKQKATNGISGTTKQKHIAYNYQTYLWKPEQHTYSPNLATQSTGQLCDAQCTGTFTDTTIKITCNNETILQGTRTTHDNLWLAC